MTQVYVREVTGMRPIYYLVYVDGMLRDSIPLLIGPPLTFTQMDDIAAGYREYFESEQDNDPTPI